MLTDNATSALPTAAASTATVVVSPGRPPAPAVKACPRALPEDMAGEASASPTPLSSGSSLAEGMALLLALTIVQRAVGFGRGLLFCRWLAPEELGRWDLAWGFFMLVAPLAVLGLPGSFGRYVERYRQGGQLRSFLWQSTWACAVLVAVAVSILGAAPQWFALGVFNSTDQAGLLLLAALGLPAIIAFNYLVELFTALRQVRVVSAMQFANGILFAAIALGLVAGTGWGAAAVAWGYILACLLTALAAGACLVAEWRSLPDDAQELPPLELAATLLPFAGWVWVTNLVTNLVDVADRWMIVHGGIWPADVAEGLLGQYHSSRVLPVLLVQLAFMIGGILLPHLSVEWEAGRQHRVSEQVNLAIKLMALFLTTCGVGILFVGPWLFGEVLGGKYAAGLEIMPWTLVACAWQGTAVLAHYYLWCAERARLSCVALACALAVNVALNLALAPWLGLNGVVIATGIGQLVNLLMVYYLGGQMGLRVHAPTWVATLLPLSLAGGAWTALAGLVAFGGWLALVPDLLSDDERHWLAAAQDDLLARLGRFRG